MSEEELEGLDNYIIVYDEEGNEIKMYILFTFESEHFGKSYAIVYEEDQADQDEITLHAFSYLEDSDDQGQLYEIESDEEWDMVEEVLATFVEDTSID